MSQEQPFRRYTFFAKWRNKITLFVLLPLLVVSGLLLKLSSDRPNTLTAQQGWHPLMQWLGVSGMGTVLIALVVLGIVELRWQKKQRGNNPLIVNRFSRFHWDH